MSESKITLNHTHNNPVEYKIYKNGDLYLGTIKRKKLEGQGVLFFQNPKIRCEGYWHRNLLEGIGRQTGPGDNNYLGYYKEGEKHGLGRSISPNMVTIGEYSYNRVDGFAIMTDFARGVVKKGYMIEEEIEEFGCLDSLDGQYSYAGWFTEAQFHGLGELSVRGTYYLGEFKQGKKQGLGVLKDEQDVYFYGQFNENVRNGFGIEAKNLNFEFLSSGG